MNACNPRYAGLLGGLAAIIDIQEETGCTWEEARQRWQASISPPEPENVVYVDFGRKDR